MTYIYERCTVNDAIERARHLGRLATRDTPGNFTCEAIRELFDWHEEIAEAMGKPIELDIIAWCCDWSEYDSIAEAAEEYDNETEVSDLLADLKTAEREVSPDLAEGLTDQLREWLEDRTAVRDVGDTGRVLIQSF